MTVEEIFVKLSAHMINGMMFHEQMANYYDFIGLCGYKRCHEYHYICETIEHRKLNRCYINKYNKMIPEPEFDNQSVIPPNWYRYTRQEVDNSTKRNVVENGVAEWLKWERETHKLYTDMYKELYDLGEITSAAYMECLIHKVEKEIKHAERKQLDLEAVEYNLSYVIGKQQCIHDKYKKKLEKKVIRFD